MKDLVFEDDKKSRYKLSKQNLLDLEQGMVTSMSSVQLAVPQDKPILPPIPKETEIIFVNDGSRYKPIDPSRPFQPSQIEYIQEPFTFVESFCKYRTELFFLIEVLYAGACFLGLLFLPTDAFDPIQAVPIANTTTYPYSFTPKTLTEANFGIFSFVLYYSHKAAKASYAFQLLATLNVCSCIAKFMDQIEMYYSNVQITWAIVKRTLYAILGSLCIVI
jgi:hypothetical protein